MVSVYSPAPAVAELGDRLVIAGTGLLVETGMASVAPPPHDVDHIAMAMQAVARIPTLPP
jgi:hypothetical protein